MMAFYPDMEDLQMRCTQGRYVTHKLGEIPQTFVQVIEQKGRLSIVLKSFSMRLKQFAR